MNFPKKLDEEVDKDRNFLEKELGNEFSEWIQILIKTPDLYVISGGKTT